MHQSLIANILAVSLAVSVAGCGAIYQSPAVRATGLQDSQVQVVPMTAETVLIANRSPYQPQVLPGVFSQTAGATDGLRGAGELPDPPSGGPIEAATNTANLPPDVDPGPYKIGIGDVMILAMPQDPVVTPGTGAANLSVSQNRRNNYTVQDDGSITVPDLGRVPVAGLTVSQAEDVLFQKLVENQIDPSFNIEIAEFNSSRVAIGGAVANPGLVPVALSPLYLDEALNSVGGIEAPDGSIIRLYRDGQLYQIPLDALYSDQSLARVRLLTGDSIFVDTGTDLNQAQDYFAEQIQVTQLRQAARVAALQELNTVVSLNRAALNEARANYQTRADLDAVDRDYVYLTGEVGTQGRFTMPFGQEASLADALYGQAGGIPVQTGNVAEIYVLRASTVPGETGMVTAWHLDGRNVVNLVLATQFMLRPNDIVFVAEQPVTRWARIIQQITPSLITTGVNAAGG